MPWSEKDVARKNKKAARSPKAKRAWTKVANKTLRDSGGDEGKAIRIANYVAGRVGRKSKRSSRRSSRK